METVLRIEAEIENIISTNVATVWQYPMICIPAYSMEKFAIYWGAINPHSYERYLRSAEKTPKKLGVSKVWNFALTS